MRTACGLVGVVSPDVPIDVSELIAAMRAIQHRGCHSWGVANLDAGVLQGQSQSGLLPDRRVELRPRPMRWALGHVGYDFTQDPRHSKRGGECGGGHAGAGGEWGSGPVGQPVLAQATRGEFAVAFNGRLGHVQLDHAPAGIDDVQRIAAGIATHPSKKWVEAIHDTAASCVAAYAVQVLTDDGLYYVRDGRGYRPLIMTEIMATVPAQADGTPAKDWKCVSVTSESSAATALQRRLAARFPEAVLTLREHPIRPGTIGHIRLDGSWTEWAIKQQHRDTQGGPFKTSAVKQRCALEAIHFMRGGGHFDELDLDYFREECGRELARTDKKAGHIFSPSNTVVVGCPRGGIASGRGYAAAACLPYAQVLRAAAGVTRAPQPRPPSTRTDDEHASSSTVNRVVRKRKEQPTLVMDGDVAGRTVMLVDDLVVQAATITKAVRLLRKAGAMHVHVRIAAPAIQSNCVWGTVLPDVEDLFAGPKPPAAQRIAADSLAYLSSKSFEKLIGRGFCKGCFFKPTDARSDHPSKPAQ